MLYFVRHGESEANLEKTFAGSRIDSPLTNKGKEQARKTAQVIIDSGILFDRIVSSPLSRAHETGLIIKEIINNKSEVVIDNRLTEINFGDITGKHYVSKKEINLATVNNTELPIIIYQRVYEILEELKQTDENILIV